LLVCYTGHLSAATYHINGECDGCEYGKLYELIGGGVLECQGCNYFYAYSPEVRHQVRWLFVEKGEHDPWAYAQHHCTTGANIYSRLHWSWMSGSDDTPT
jgi:hypothetical protein